MTAQEEDLKLHYLKSIDKLNSSTLAYEVEYEDTSDMNQTPKAEGALF